MSLLKNNQIGFNFYLYSMLGIIAMLGMSFVVVAYSQEEYELALEKRTISIRLAEELRQSSNDLTRLARTYISTGDPLYKSQFNMVVDIRDGKIPRPINYSLAYWDFKAVKQGGNNGENEKYGEAIPLLKLMRKAGVTESELHNLEISKSHSDDLVKIEKAAMELVDVGNNVNQANVLRALSMVADERFLSIKAKVMRPIIDTERIITTRTQVAVDEAHSRLKIAIASLFLLGFSLVVLMLKLRQQVKMIIGCSIPDLQKTIVRLGSGDFFTPISVAPKSKDSVLGWIAQTQRKLAELDLVHFKFIVNSSDDAIISKSNKGIIASWNRGAEKIFGYKAEEIVGKPMQIIIPPEREHEEPEILERISRGETVDHFETQRLHRDGHLVDVSVTISPVYDVNGIVVGASKIARDISKAKAAEKEIHRLAFYDTLTGLANRRLLHDRLEQSIVRYPRSDSGFALLFLDLDNFKSLNDNKGHEAGDELLKEVAKRLLSCVRSSDTVARFGGDEFVVLLNADNEKIQYSKIWIEGVLNKIIIEIGRPYHIDDVVHECTTSLGVALFFGQECSASDLLKMADGAMYEAKKSGKNCYKFANEYFSF